MNSQNHSYILFFPPCSGILSRSLGGWLTYIVTAEPAWDCPWQTPDLFSKIQTDIPAANEHNQRCVYLFGKGLNVTDVHLDVKVLYSSFERKSLVGICACSFSTLCFVHGQCYWPLTILVCINITVQLLPSCSYEFYCFIFGSKHIVTPKFVPLHVRRKISKPDTMANSMILRKYLEMLKYTHLFLTTCTLWLSTTQWSESNSMQFSSLCNLLKNI